MKKKLFFLSLFTCVLTVQAQENKEKMVQLEEVVIDSRFKIKREHSGKVVHKITTAQIQQNASKSVAELINYVAGIEINGATSVDGQNLGLYIRGGRSNEVVVLIDGVQVIDPLQNGYDLRLLNLDNVASIEIIKGAASTLYGSGAATAVIDIRLKKPSNKAISASVTSSIGTNNTASKAKSNIANFNNSINVNGKANKFSYLLSFGHQFSEGISAAKPMDNTTNFDDDKFSKINTNLNLGYAFSEDLKVNFFGSFAKIKNNYDEGSFMDANNQTEDKNYRTGMHSKYTYGNGSIHLQAVYSIYKLDGINTSFPRKNEGENVIGNLFVKHNFNDTFYTILGVNTQQNSIETYEIPWGSTELVETVYAENPEAILIDPYVNAVYISNFGLNLNAGLRLNNHNKYGNHLVYNFNPSYTIIQRNNNYTKLFGSYSTAYVAPSLQDLYASWGNVDLKPQESTTFEGGIETKFRKTLISATYFKRDIESIITYSFNTFTLTNSGNAKVDGVEFSVDTKHFKNAQFLLNYTYTNNSNEALRIPKHKVNLLASYNASNKTSFTANYQYNSNRDETYFKPDFTSEPVTLKAYSLLNLGINYVLINNRLKTFLNVTNILNEDYEEIYGFNTKGRNYNLGFKLTF